MHPIIVKIPLGWVPWSSGALSWFPWHPTVLPLYSYGVMLGLSIVVGWYLTLGLADRDGLPKEEMANNYVFTAILAIIGSRILYVVTNLDEFKSFGDVFNFRAGGLVAYGGFLGGFVGSYLYLKRKRLPLLPWADVAVPSLATGLLITRIGCYLFGCDFGKPLGPNAPRFLKSLGTFPHWPEGTLDKGMGSPAWYQHYQQHLVPFDAPASLPVHPTQLYESLVGLCLFGIVMLQRKHQRFRGQVFLIFTFAYGVLRYGLEILRDDAERGEYGPQLPEHVIVPGGFLAFGLAYIFFVSRAIENKAIRGVTQVVAIIPGIVAYWMLKPASFADQALVRLSTSQWVALLTGIAAAFYYMTLFNASKAHPEAAMEIDLSAYRAANGIPEPEAPKKRKKKRKKPETEPPVQAAEEATEPEHREPEPQGTETG